MMLASKISSRTAVRTTATKKTGTAVSGRAGGAGYKKFQGDALWLPNTTRPEWLDGAYFGVAVSVRTEAALSYQLAELSTPPVPLLQYAHRAFAD